MEASNSTFGLPAVSISKQHENLENEILKSNYLRKETFFLVGFLPFIIVFPGKHTKVKPSFMEKFYIQLALLKNLLVLIAAFYLSTMIIIMCALKFFRWLH